LALEQTVEIQFLGTSPLLVGALVPTLPNTAELLEGLVVVPLIKTLERQEHPDKGITAEMVQLALIVGAAVAAGRVQSVRLEQIQLQV
jgi:hypothetical protein